MPIAEGKSRLSLDLDTTVYDRAMQERDTLRQELGTECRLFYGWAFRQIGLAGIAQLLLDRWLVDPELATWVRDEVRRRHREQTGALARGAVQ
jgi:hypothetical protein